MAVRDCFGCAPTLPEMMQKQRLEVSTEQIQPSITASQANQVSSTNNAFNDNNFTVQRAATVNSVTQPQAITDSLIESSLETARQSIDTYAATGEKSTQAQVGSLVNIKV